MSDVPLLEKAILVDRWGNDCELFKLKDVVDALRKYQSLLTSKEVLRRFAKTRCGIMNFAKFLVQNEPMIELLLPIIKEIGDEVFGVLDSQDDLKEVNMDSVFKDCQGEDKP